MTQEAKKMKLEARSPEEDSILMIDKQLRKFKNSEELLDLAERLFQKEPTVVELILKIENENQF